MHASKGESLTESLTSVVCFDAAKDIETHIHRVGRTGRAGDKGGQAITLLVDPLDAKFTLGKEWCEKILLSITDLNTTKSSYNLHFLLECCSTVSPLLNAHPQAS